MAVEVAAKHAVEGPVAERQRQRLRVHDLRTRAALASDLAHRRALVQRRHVPVQVPGQEPRAARHVERAHRRQLGDQALQAHQLGLPARALAAREQPAAEVPVVVLRGALFVVRLHID